MTRLHPLSAKDQATVAAIGLQSAPFKGMMSGPEARAPYDAMIAAIPGVTGIRSEPAHVGGVAGYWIRPEASPADAAMLWAVAEAEAGRGLAPAACVVISPWADLTGTSESTSTRAEEDPFVTAAMLRTCAAMYLGPEDASAPDASPIFGARVGLPPVQIHVGTREILLDDSIGYADRVTSAGGRVDLHIWEGMPHVFPSSFANLDAGEAAMGRMAAFVREQVGH